MILKVRVNKKAKDGFVLEFDSLTITVRWNDWILVSVKYPESKEHTAMATNIIVNENGEVNRLTISSPEYAFTKENYPVEHIERLQFIKTVLYCGRSYLNPPVIYNDFTGKTHPIREVKNAQTPSEKGSTDQSFRDTKEDFGP